MSDTVIRPNRKHTKANNADKRIFNIFGYPIVGIFGILCLLPFVLIVSASFSSEQSILQYGYRLWPREFTFEGYAISLANPASIIRAYGVTIFVTSVGTIVSVFINTMTGYVLQRKDFPWRNGFSYYFFFTTLFNGGLVPWYILCVNTLHFKNNIWGLILPGLMSVWNILLVKGFMRSIPFEITESAKCDGAGDFTIFLKLILPLSKPVIATIGLFTALMYWNDWYHCLLFISDSHPELFTLQYFLYRLLQSVRNIREIMDQAGIYIPTPPVENMKMALTVIVTGPIVFLYPFVQKYFIKGLTLGSVKG